MCILPCCQYQPSCADDPPRHGALHNSHGLPPLHNNDSLSRHVAFVRAVHGFPLWEKDVFDVLRESYEDLVVIFRYCAP